MVSVCVSVCVCSKTLSSCGDVEDLLARECVKFELDVENQFIQTLHNIGEVPQHVHL